MGLAEDVATVRADVSNHAQNFFLYWFKKQPDYQPYFAIYKNVKKLEKLKDMDKFVSHTTAVLTKLLVFVDKNENAPGLRIESKKLSAMPQHIGLEEQHFTDLFAALLEYLEGPLGPGMDKAGWEKASKNIIKAIANEL